MGKFIHLLIICQTLMSIWWSRLTKPRQPALSHMSLSPLFVYVFRFPVCGEQPLRGRGSLTERCSFHGKHPPEGFALYFSLSGAPSVEDAEAKVWSRKERGIGWLPERGAATHFTWPVLHAFLYLQVSKDTRAYLPAYQPGQPRVFWAFSCPLTRSFVHLVSGSSTVLRISSHAFTFLTTQFFPLAHFQFI